MALDLNDKTSNAANLTNVNGVTDNTSNLPSVTGDTHAAGFAKASTQYLTGPNDASGWQPSTNITVELWAYFNTTPSAGHYPRFVSNLSTDANNTGWAFFTDGDNSHVRWYVQGNGSAINLQSTIAPSTGAWHHYAITFDGSTGKFYLDGVLHDTVSGSQALTYGTVQKPAIGIGYSGGYVYPFDGYMDEIRIWNTIRTATEINNNKGVRLTGSESGLVAYYPFETLGYTQTLSETITITDSLLRTLSRLLVESATITDTFTSLRIISSILSETITISDTMLRTIQRSLTDTLTIADTLIKQVSRSLAETLTLTDTFVSVTTFLKTLSESIIITEYFTPRLNGLLAFWHRVAKTTGSWTKKAKSTSALWTRIGKQ